MEKAGFLQVMNRVLDEGVDVKKTFNRPAQSNTEIDED